MIPNEVYARRHPAEADDGFNEIKIVGIDQATGAVLITSATEFGEVFGVDPGSLMRHYALKQTAEAPGAWETPLEEVVG